MTHEAFVKGLRYIRMLALTLTLLGALGAVAFAQPPPPETGATPAPSAPQQPPPPVPVATPAPAAAPSSGFSYLPTLDIIVTSAWATGADDQAAPNGPFTDGTTRLGGKITFPIAKSLNLSYSHTFLDYMLGGIPGFNGNFIDDPVDTAAINYAHGGLGISGGWFYRHRVCCPSAGDPTTLLPITWHNAFLAFTYGVPIAALGGSTFSVTAQLNQTLAHHPAPAFVLAANPQIPADKGNLFYPTGSATLTVPVDKKHGFNVYGTYLYTAEYFDNQPIPFWYNAAIVGLGKSFGKVVTLNGDLVNVTQHAQGYPFPDSGTIHVNKFVLTLDVRVGP